MNSSTAIAVKHFTEMVRRTTTSVNVLIGAMRHHEWDEEPDWLRCRCESCGQADSSHCHLPPTQEDMLCDPCRAVRVSGEER